MKILTRDEILNAADLQTETLGTPEWGEDSGVYVRSLTGEEREAIDQLQVDAKKAGKPLSVFALVAAFSIVDGAGVRIFSNENIPSLARKNSGPLERIWDWHVLHSGIGGKAAEEARKNSSAGQNGATSSASRSASGG